MSNESNHEPLGPSESLPAAGWYADPEIPGQHRWWDGFRWTEATMSSDGQQRTGSGGNPGAGLEPVGPWLSSVMDVIKERAGHLFTLVVVISLPISLISGLLTWRSLQGLTVSVDQPNGSFEFIGFAAEDAYLFFGAFLLSTLSGLVLAAAIVHQASHARAGAPLPWGESLAHAGRRLPRVVGAFLGLALVYLALGVAFGVVVGFGASAGGIGVVVLGSLLFVLLAFYVAVRLSLVATSAAVAPAGVNSFAASWRLTGGKFWAVFGRLALLVVLLFGIQLTGSVITAPFAGAFGSQVDPDASIIIVADLFGASNAPLFLALQVVGALFGGLTSAIWGIGLLFVYRALGGRIAAELGLQEIAEPGPAGIT